MHESLFLDIRSGQAWRHTPEQRVAAYTLRRYSFGFRLAIAQADARPAVPVSLKYDSASRNHEVCGHSLGKVWEFGRSKKRSSESFRP